MNVFNLRRLRLTFLLLCLAAVSQLSQGQHMLFHLLGAGQPIANFTTTSQTVAESTGVWAGWSSNLSAWTKRRQILVDGVGGALTDFPVMIKLDSTRIDYAQVQAAGQDLRFANDAGTLLSYEIEKWDPAGTSIVWVKVPALAAYPTKSSIWMYYGNASASDAQSATAWDANFAKVMHLNGTAGSIGNGAVIPSAVGAAGTANNGGSGMSYAAGQVANGVVLDGTDDWINIGSDASLNFGANAPLTVSVFFKTTDTSGPIVNFRDLVTGSPIVGLYIGNNGASAQYGMVNVILRDDSGSTYAQIAGPTINDDLWHHLVLSRNAGSSISLYVDGVSYGTAAGASTGGAITTTQKAIGSDRYWVTYGNNSVGERFFAGAVDQLEVSTVQRSADWIQASYLSARDELTTFRSEETPTSGAAIITVQLNTSATTTITIPYTVSGTATAGTDHSRVSGNLVINGGSSSGSLNTYVLRDNLVEGSETAILTLGAPTGASLGPDTVHTVTITDEVLSPPDAVNDSINVTNFSAVTIPVLANDTDANGDTLTITAVSSPTAGTAVRVGQTIRYTPTQDFPATDSFTYTISDGRGGTDTATVTVNYQIPFTWIGSGADANWTTTANWLGGVVPGAANTVYFNNQCTTYCNPQINAGASVNNFRMNTSFAGTITQGAASLTVAGSWLQKAGTFTGSSSSISIGYYLTIDGGTFTSTSGDLSYGVSAQEMATTTVFKIASGATFNNNVGTVRHRASRMNGASPYLTIDVPTDTTFNNFVFDDAQCGVWWYYGGGGSSWGANHHRMLNRIRINGTLTHNCGQLLGDIALYGNLVMGANARANAWNTGSIQFLGTAVQTYEISVAGGRTHNVTVNKTGGSVSANSTTFAMTSLTITQGSVTAPTGTLSIGASVMSSSTQNVFTIAAGQTFSHNSGTVEFISGLGNCSYTSTVNINVDSTLTLNNVAITGAYDACYGGRSDIILNAADTITVLGNLTLNGGRLFGSWNVAGNTSVTSTNFGGGTATLLLNGTVGQSLSQVASSTMPSGTLTVNKASGTTTQTTAISLAGAGQDLTLTTGTYDMAGFALAVNDVLTVGTNAKLLCNGGTLTYASAVINGEVSCGPSVGITWTGLAGDGLWTTAGNWTNNTIPGASDIAYFNGKCTNCNATINSAISVKGVVMASSYTGTITQGAGNTITVGTSGWSIAAGTFAGNDAAVSINGTLAISGGVYTATSAATSIGVTTGNCATVTALNMTAGTFNHGNGRLKIYGGRSLGASCNGTAQIAFPVGFTVYDLETVAVLSAGGWHSYLTATSATTMIVEHNLYDYGHSYSFTFDLKGDLYNNRSEDLGSGLVKMTGTVDQYYTFTGGSKGSPTIQINKVSGLVQPAGGVTNLVVWSLELLQGGFTAPSGSLYIGTDTWISVSHNALLVSSGTTFNTNGGTIKFNMARMSSNATTQTISVPAGFVFNNVEINNTNLWSSGWGDYIASATTLVVAGNLTFAGKANNANWDVSGNIVVSTRAEGGTGTIRAAGSANQTVTGSPAAKFSHFTIASTGGTVTLAGTLNFPRNFTYTSGTVDAGTSTAYFDAQTGFSNTITPGVMTFNNVTFTGYTGVFTISGTLDVLGF